MHVSEYLRGGESDVKTTTFIAAAIVMLLFGNWVQAGISIVHNGSFENDGGIPDINSKAPQYWCDVNLPENKFGGWVKTDWSTYGDYSLTLSSNRFLNLEVGDTATVSQQVYLTDVNQIIFDVKLGTTRSDIPWDPNERSALLLIDDEVAWDSNSLGPNADGEFLNETVDVNEIYKDANLHTLSLAMTVDVNDTFTLIEYRARWDFVKFDAHCGGFGYLPEDFSQDCYVDMNDLKMLAGQWLVEDPNEKYDLFWDGIVNFRDFAFFAEYWTANSYWENWQNDNCYQMELLSADLNDDGVVNLVDFAILTGDWGSGDDCIRSDIDRSGVVDYKDLSIMTEQWLLRSWLYGLE